MPAALTFMNADDRAFCEAISGLTFCNPFLPERLDWERKALGCRFEEQGSVWSAQPDSLQPSANILAIEEAVEERATELRSRLAKGAKASPAELALYEDLIIYLVYYRHENTFYKIITSAPEGVGEATAAYSFYTDLCADTEHFLAVIPARSPPAPSLQAHLFAGLFQIRRAFHFIFRYVVGQSLATARLRAAIWQSVFTCDMRRYRRSLYNRLGDIAVLVTGPSGSGKELVARAIGYSRYIPFDHRRKTFETNWRDSFHALNLTALSPTLIESELFGHRKGAFTGALEDHVGWLEACGPYGSVFLDEIGDVNTEIQVKLLRVLEARRFSRLGETESRSFEGKLIAATNRDLDQEIDKGTFRTDLYYRLCSDIVATPSLRERIADCPEELATLTTFLAQRVAGPEEAPALAAQVLEWIEKNLGSSYTWPGNVRELEQCVRNVLIRGHYRPHRLPVNGEDFLSLARNGQLSADALLSHYCKLVYDMHGSYEGAGRVLGLDRRTVKSRIEALG